MSKQEEMKVGQEQLECCGGCGFDDAKRVGIEGKKLHFVGIGGCGMSGLAQMCKRFGAECSGSDISESAVVMNLREAGIKVVSEQTKESLPAEGEVDCVVISAAIKDDHPEVVEAKKRGLEIKKYAKLLGELMIGRQGIAIAGTHGKSSTTSMLAHVLIETGLDPSFIVGANCEQIGGGYRVGCDEAGKDILLAEACEFDPYTMTDAPPCTDTTPPTKRSRRFPGGFRFSGPIGLAC